MNDEQATATPREISDTVSGDGEHGLASVEKVRVGQVEFDDSPQLANSATAGAGVL